MNCKEPGGKEGLNELEENLFFLSHELRAPLRRINGFAQLLAKTPPQDEKAALYSSRILAGTERMAEIIDGIFRYSFAVAQPAEPASTDLRAAADGAIRALEPEIAKAGGRVSNYASGTVMADPAKLEAIVAELIGNALRFRGARPLRVRLSSRAGKGEIVLSVSDNGTGFRQADAKAAFDLLRRLHAGEYPGAGAGLALCRRLAEQCGGRIWAVSRPGKGSVFSLALAKSGGVK